jgi:flavin-binding protein dodecin
LVKVGGQVDSAGVPESYDVTLDITFTVKESPHN